MPALADLGRPGTAGDRPDRVSPGRNPGRWADLGKRTLSAVVLAPAALLCVWFGSWAWFVLMWATAIGLGLEWTALCKGPNRFAAISLIPVLAMMAAVEQAVAGTSGGALIALLVGTVVALLLSRSAALAAGVLYAGVPLAALAWLRGADATGRAGVLLLIAVVWASDIGAYLVGRLVGGPRLAPAVSPGKTWSGAVGGLVAAVLAGEVAAHWLGWPDTGPVAAVACLLGIASQAGDLLESWIKRRFGVKDSGWLIPGHGGLLDRLDGLLAAALAAACIAMATGRGGLLWN